MKHAEQPLQLQLHPLVHRVGEERMVCMLFAWVIMRGVSEVEGYVASMAVVEWHSGVRLTDASV